MIVSVIAGCISCGLCTEEVPDLFVMNDDGLAHPVAHEVPAGKEKEAQQAAEDCPVSVIITA
jgi:ferredoxin